MSTSNVNSTSIGQQWRDARTQRTNSAGSLVQDIGNNMGGGRTYTIQFGDTLTEIVRALQQQPGYTGSGNIQEDIRRLAAANGISDPNKIQAGKQLDLSALTGGGQQPQQPGNVQPNFGNPNLFALMQQYMQQQALLQQQQFNPFFQPQQGGFFNPVNGLAPFLGTDNVAAALATIDPFTARQLAIGILR